MSSLLLSLPELFNSYKTWVSKNPQIASDYETTAKWISYFIAGRINNSHVVSELVYCLSNLLVLFNDGIIRNSVNQTVSNSSQKIKLWLTVVEYSEVFCELSVQKVWGKRGKWLIVVAIQVFKCIARFLLFYKYKEPITENPPIPPIARQKINAGKSPSDDLSGFNNSDLSNISFTLKRSGRVVRKVESSPPMALRSWKPLELKKPISECTVDDIFEERGLKRRQLIAESLYISKPIVHLISMGVFGTRAWKPWMVSLSMDLISLQLYKSTQKQNIHALTKDQKLQLSKRTVLLLMYLIRSPVYEKYSRDKINAFLTALSNNLPLVKIVCQPLMQYLPFWQSNYFHMWST